MENATLFKNDIHIVLHRIGMNISIHYSHSARPFLFLDACFYFRNRSSLCVCFLYSCEALEFPCRRLFQGFLEDWEERVYRGCGRSCRGVWEAYFQHYWDGWESLECWPCNWGNKRNRPRDLLWDDCGIKQKLHAPGRRKDCSDPKVCSFLRRHTFCMRSRVGVSVGGCVCYGIWRECGSSHR